MNKEQNCKLCEQIYIDFLTLELAKCQVRHEALKLSEWECDNMLPGQGYHTSGGNNTELWSNGWKMSSKRNPKKLTKLLQCHFVHLKSYVQSTGIEPGALQSEASA
jgi:hypothetical protein